MNKIIIYYSALCVIIIAIIMSLWFIPYGRDFNIYNSVYNGSTHTEFEYLFQVLFDISNTKISLITLWVLVLSFTLSIKIYVVSNLADTKRQFIFFCFMYVFSYFLLHELTQLRISLALSFIFLSIYYLVKSKTKAAFILSVIACFFHNGVIIYVISIVLVGIYKRIGFYKTTKLCLISSVIMMFVIPTLIKYILIFRPSALGYIENWNSYHMTLLTIPNVITYFCFALTYLMVKDNIKLGIKYSTELLYLYTIISLSISLCFIFIPEVSIRYYDLTALFLMILFCNIKIRRNYISYLYIFSIFILFFYRFYGFIFYKPLFVF
ncbi:hypothetical protein C9J19_03830 [Photobacterium phosphoreum]|uniref:EpsG family protein n=1 Tax=Photobacterium phosphoreum TaxID=659 RepID=UPI000D156715|nr:EpsG family protein [Photobacterium phosphoreum]PSW30382.1 hypothetical protein C9J19_03830 [Photobacterium phosphoreum]